MCSNMDKHQEIGHTEERYLIQTGELGNARRPECNLKESSGVGQAKDWQGTKATYVTMYINNHTRDRK